MNIQSLKFACFSPTGTTKTIIRRVAQGMNLRAELIDITKPDARKHPLRTSEHEFLIVAVPVYMGRVPALLHDWLHAIQADRTPAACIVVYGNRAYEDALLELNDILTQRGCVPIAGAAYIGEHSFSSSETPTAEGRPDASDLHHAEMFGRKIHEKLLSVSSVEQISKMQLPGNYPYGGMTTLWSIDFIAVDHTCTQCGICAEGCPVGAISRENSAMIDREQCITCCACIKNCPQHARTMKNSPAKDAAMRLHTLYKERKEPVFFL